jgi:hypothetical protein
LHRVTKNLHGVFGRGHVLCRPEIVTFVTLAETVLLIPLVIAAIRLPLAFGVIDFDPADFPLP